MPKLILHPNDVRIALNIICDGIVALVFVPLVGLSLAFAEIPVMVVVYIIVMTGVVTLVYYIVDRHIPAEEEPIVKTNTTEIQISEATAPITVPEKPIYPPKSGPSSSIRYKRKRRGIVLLPYVLLALAMTVLCARLLLGSILIETVNNTLLFLEVICILLIIFDRRFDEKASQRVSTALICILLAAIIIYVWTAQQPISIMLGQLAIVSTVIALKVYLWNNTWLIMTQVSILYVIMTPLGNIGPSIEIKSAGAPNITQSLLDIMLNTCTIHLDTASVENGRWKALHFAVSPDEIRPLFGQPTSVEIKQNTRDTKLREKAFKEQRRKRAKRVK